MIKRIIFDSHISTKRFQFNFDGKKTGSPKPKRNLKYNFSSVPSLPVASNASGIKERLKTFFQGRPTFDDLFKKGIMQNEAVFGSNLVDLHKKTQSTVPHFVKKCVERLDSEEFIIQEKIYGTSGCMNVIQKIRFEANEGKYDTLDNLLGSH